MSLTIVDHHCECRGFIHGGWITIDLRSHCDSMQLIVANWPHPAAPLQDQTLDSCEGKLNDCHNYPNDASAPTTIHIVLIGSQPIIRVCILLSTNMGSTMACCPQISLTEMPDDQTLAKIISSAHLSEHCILKVSVYRNRMKCNG